MKIVRMLLIADLDDVKEILDSGKSRGDIIDWMLHPVHGLLIEGQDSSDTYSWAHWFLVGKVEQIEIVDLETIKEPAHAE